MTSSVLSAVAGRATSSGAAGRRRCADPGIRWALGAAGLLLALLAAAAVAGAAAAIARPGEIEYVEAIIYGQAARLLRGEPLYQALNGPSYTVAAYTPLYYWLAGGLQALVGPGFGPGRSVSVIASILAAAAVARLTQRRTGSPWAGALSAGLFLGLGLPWVPHVGPPWSGLYKEDMLGVALAVWSVACLASSKTWRHVTLGATLAALAILTKQTLAGASVAGFIWLWRQDRTKAAAFAAICLAIIGSTFAALEITTGAFFMNVVSANVNPLRMETLTTNLTILVLFQSGPLALSMQFVTRQMRGRWSTSDGLVALYWLAALLPLAGLAKAGSNHNYWTELAGASAVLATTRIWTLWRAGRGNPSPASPSSARLAVAMLCATPMLWLLPCALVQAPDLVQRRQDLVTSGDNGGGAFDAVVQRVRAEPRDVLAEPLDVVVLAGRPVVLEPYVYSILERQGHWAPAPLLERICNGHVGLLVLGYPIQRADERQRDGYPFWPAPVMALLRATFVLEGEQGGRFIYVPVSARNDAACASLAQGRGNPPVPAHDVELQDHARTGHPQEATARHG